MINALSLGILLTLSCLVPISDDRPQEPFQFFLAGVADDTVSPFGPLYLRFTSPVMGPDSVRFIFNPSFSEYLVTWNPSHDSAWISFMLPLDGNSKYSVRPANRITATDGSLLSPGKDSIAFITHYGEQEPNDSRNLADTLRGTVFGRMAMANDTDWFVVSNAVNRAFYLKSSGSTSTFAVRDNNGETLAPRAYASAETLSVPVNFVSPLYLKVYPHNHSNGGTYELGWTGGE